ncbi:MAG: outer membrane beta-barrel protein [Hymenobacteraceae bacterium]|nr:outer membrane beta-barrel protein [Hymenobacteraceae bacterium]
MKKIFTTALMVMLGAGAYAQTAPQISQGNMVVSGSANLGNYSTDYDNSPTNSKDITRSFRFNPSMGYFLQDGLEMGVSLGLYQGLTIYKRDSVESRSRSQNISFSPYVRQYIALTEQLQLHGTVYISASIGNSKYQQYEKSSYKETNTSKSYGIGFYPGLTYFASPKLGFTATFGDFSYSRSKSTPKNNPHQTSPHTSNSFTANLSPSSINIGIGYFIAR